MSIELTNHDTIPAIDLPGRSIGEIIFKNISSLSALLVLGILVAIIASLFVGSWLAIKEFHFFGFLGSDQWNPVTRKFGALVPVVGTLVTSCIAMLIAIPVSFGIALFLTELAPVWLKRPLGTAIELLAAIPSIIYGMWGLFVFAPAFADSLQPWIKTHIGGLPLIGVLFQGPPMGIGILTAGLILAIMVIPFIAAVMRDVFEIVPAALKESAYALGSTTWEVVWKVVLPYTKAGVLAGIMLGLGRALGETMAVTFVIGNAHKLHTSLFMPGNSIASTLANEFTEAIGDLYTSSLIYLGLLLFLITFIVLAVSRFLLARMSARAGK
ncbi:MAG: phosphate ABC transporter permease subunit PstC [Desulfobacterales bacterium]|jgi:phosphate transport system permease protein